VKTRIIYFILSLNLLKYRIKNVIMATTSGNALSLIPGTRAFLTGTLTGWKCCRLQVL
jgi:hypothetical protein